MRRAFVFDLDGTLLDSDGQLSAATVEALREERARGSLLAVATARPLRLARSALGRHVGLVDALIVSNGAATHEGPSSTLVDEAPLPARRVAHVLSRSRRLWPGCGIGWERGDGFFHDPSFAGIATQRTITRFLDHPPADGPTGQIHQLVIATTTPHSSADLQRLRSHLGRRTSVTDSAGGVIEVSSRRADKAMAMLRWASRHGVGAPRITAFGDGLNDIGMLRSAGTSVAMGNAAAEVAAAATHRALAHDQDGVAQFLQSLRR